MSMYHSLLYVVFLISFAQCQTTLSQAEISQILQLIQNQPGTQTSPQANNAETVQLLTKLMASSQSGNQAQQIDSQQMSSQQMNTQQMNSQPLAPVQPPNTANTQSNILLPLAAAGAIENPLTAIAATSMASNSRPGTHNPMSNYITARALDFNDFTTNMMLFNGLSGKQQQQPQQQQQQQTVSQGTQQQTKRPASGGLFGQSPVNNYMTARMFDFPDMYTNMMLFPGFGTGRQHQQTVQPTTSQQQTGQQNPAQSTFDPTLYWLYAN